MDENFLFLHLCLSANWAATSNMTLGRWGALSVIPCMRGCFQTRRTCRTEPCCRWICQGFWWRCFPRRSSSVTGHAATTWCARAAPWSRRSSWCPARAPLKGTRGEVIGAMPCCGGQMQWHGTFWKKNVVTGGATSRLSAPPPLVSFQTSFSSIFQGITSILNKLQPLKIQSQLGCQQEGY